MTVSGKQCQQWTSQSPHGHGYTTEKYPDSGLGPHSFCRSAKWSQGAWCYTTDPGTRWEKCDVGQASPSCGLNGE